MDVDADVVIVGAGLAGLCCARAVEAAGRTALVLEAGDGVGGRVRTDQVDGFLVDRGFQILLTGYPEVARQLDVEALDLRAFDPGSLVWTGTGFDKVADPLRRPSQMIPTLRADVGSLADKARVGWLRQRLVAADAADLLRRPDRTTVQALEDAGFSTTMIDRFFRPLLGGIQLDPTLSSSARMFDVIFRTLAVGDAAVPADGMGSIPAQLAAKLSDGTVRLNSPVDRLEGTTAVAASGEHISGRALVVATEGPAAARLSGVRDPGSKSASAFWFAAEAAPIDGRAIALDGVGDGPVANLAVMSQVAPGYSPDGRSLVVAACPGTDADELQPAVRSQLAGWFGGAVAGWDLVAHHQIPHGQPLASVPFSPKRRVALGEGRYVTGDHRDTPSIQGAMYSGRRCAEAVLADLATS